jgi:hypothetical protein
MSHGLLRKLMSLRAHEGYAREGRPTSAQGEVWQEVGRKLGAMGSPSPTQAMAQAYEDHRQRLNAVIDRVCVPEGCCGVAFAVHGQIAGVDLFDKPATLTKLWRKLIQSYAIDALEPATSSTTRVVAAAEVSSWVASAGNVPADAFQSPGLGTDLRLRSQSLAGASLIVEQHPVHLELFPLAT